MIRRQCYGMLAEIDILGQGDVFKEKKNGSVCMYSLITHLTMLSAYLYYYSCTRIKNFIFTTHSATIHTCSIF